MLKAGFAEKDITPVEGMEMPGMFSKRFSGPVHDPLWVNGAVFEDAHGAVAVVGVDALSVKGSTVRKARAKIAEATGIAGGRVMVAASHTHNGGPTCEVFLSESDPAYCDLVAEAIAEVVIQAWEKRQEVVFKAGSGKAERVAFNRRFRMVGGTERTHPGRCNPDVIEPAGPVDPLVGALGVYAKDSGALLGCLVNFTCHCTVGVGGGSYSADYPYYLREAVKAAAGTPETVVVFTNGACGDITQVDNLKPKDALRDGGEPCGRLIGWTVAAEVLKVLARMETASCAPLAAAQDVLMIDARPVSPSVEAAARERLAARADGAAWERDDILAREEVLLAEMNRVEPKVPVEVQAVRIGPVALVSNPAEYFCALGLEIKRRSPHPFTWVVELANGCVGYVPGFEQVIKSEGYEPRLCRSSKLAPEAGTRIVEASVKLLQATHGAE
ncbi:MAG: hypothetical protein GX574_03595 [Lentisphaerae bacterium]|nr:hypothetical protein [Lentisphaerota bacterium]OQC14499.1 MAG: hypothetical protein BWX73_01758 [Lentisphaerae bacterium ADurb.Bin082]HQL88110.1 hypothetical protein [Lentisphaeria bacterium]